MSRRISIRKIIQTLVTMAAVAGCAVAMISADRRRQARRVRDVQIRVQSPGGVRFLTDDDVYRRLFTARHIAPASLLLTGLDERAMEAILKANPWVRDAQVYTDAEQVMHISVNQRVPAARLFQEDGTSYYLDAALQSMPLSTQYTHYVPVITGVPRLGSDSASLVLKGNILGLVRRIARDTFWNAQVSQLDMRADGGFEIVPVLGRQRIILGDTSRLDDKLGSLFQFYKQVLNRVGWDKYTTLDLRYKGQVVASPNLPWKAPQDKALSNMSWVKAIMESAPSRAVQLGGDASAKSDSLLPAVPVTAAAPANQQPTTAGRTSQPSPAVGLHTAARPPKRPKPPAKPAPKKPLTPKPKHTSPHPQNTRPNAAPKR